MLLNEYIESSEALLAEAAKIEASKRPAYTANSEDVLFNFKSVAKRLNITPMQAWGVYFLKHIDSISSQAKDPSIPQGEAMIGRYADAVNYLKLGFALMRDTEKKEG
jgi:3-methyladenine DNA glycosylase AlkC